MLISYARISTQDQTLDLQKNALERIGCQEIFTDIISGAITERKGLSEPIIPDDIQNAPVLNALQRFSRRKKRRRH